MKSTMRIDFEAEKIFLNKAFAREAANANSQEYKKLQMVRNDYPDFKVVTRSIKKNPNKESYKGLTYDFMEHYILTHPNSTKNKKKFDEMKVLSKCHSIRYPTIKKWFLGAYPEMIEYDKISKTKKIA